MRQRALRCACVETFTCTWHRLRHTETLWGTKQAKYLRKKEVSRRRSLSYIFAPLFASKRLKSKSRAALNNRRSKLKFRPKNVLQREHIRIILYRLSDHLHVSPLPSCEFHPPARFIRPRLIKLPAFERPDETGDSARRSGVKRCI